MSDWVTPNTATVIVGMFGAMVIGSALRLGALWGVDTDKARSRRASLRTWWMIVVVLSAAVLAGPLGVCLLLGFASWAGFSEYRSLEARDDADRFASRLLSLTIPVVYVGIYLGVGLTMLTLLPLVAVLLVATAEIVHGVTRGYVRSIGALVFGAVVLVGGLGHAAQMVVGAGAGNPLGGPVGWFLYLVILTETNDIVQALVGRRVGVRHITPKVSPNKTVEGLLGGMAVTVLMSMGLAPLLTPLPPWAWPVAAGVVISLAGFLGDLNISAVKRDAGVKDSSHALPGMGGVLDRIDSLTLTAPVFYWLIVVPTS